MQRSWLSTLPDRLAGAVSATELESATHPDESAGVVRSVRAGEIRIGTALLPRGVPDVVLSVDPAADAREICVAWRMERPVAVSPDVHQATWWVLEADRELADLHGPRVASHPLRCGRWEIIASLRGRPEGVLPELVSGASPAYDVGERGGEVVSVEIRALSAPVRALGRDDPDALAATEAARAAYPYWGGGWEAAAGSTVVVVYDGSGPAASAALADASASQLYVAQRGEGFGVVLLDALEALAADGGATRLRLDSSAFLMEDELPLDSYGYVVGPPYEGDTDVEVWAERDLG